MNLRIYTTSEGHSPFEIWLENLRDVQGRARIRAKLAQVQSGNLGDCKPLRCGVAELRIHSGPGYRVYLSRQGDCLILLLCASDKRGQARAIERAIAYLDDWKRRERR